MKAQIQAYVLLLILVGHLARPLMPYIDYALNKSYIEKNLCVNRNKPKSCCAGKCYLEKEVAKQADDSSKADKKQDNKKSSTEKDIKEFLGNSLLLPVPQGTAIAQPMPHSPIFHSLPTAAPFVPPRMMV